MPKTCFRGIPEQPNAILIITQHSINPRAEDNAFEAFIDSGLFS